ncbi:MAG: ankyrin repeat domain-containing protein [Nitrospira sp.]|nr:ankyrin repeat domain-containing protein [Nitrospira sp.]
MELGKESKRAGVALTVLLVFVFCGPATAQDLPPEVLADQYMGEGVTALENGKGKQAIEAFRKIEALDTEPPARFPFFYGKALVENSAAFDDLLKGHKLLQQFKATTDRDSPHDDSEVVQGWLGVYWQNLTPKLAEQFDVPDTKGVLVTDVVADSPAQDGDVQRGDIIRDYDGHPVDNGAGLQKVTETPPGTRVAIGIVRKGRERTLSVVIGQMPVRVWLGVSMQDLTPKLAEQFDVPYTKGVLVTDVVADSPAQDGDVQRGDIIRDYDGHPVDNLARLKKGTETPPGTRGQRNVLTRRLIKRVAETTPGTKVAIGIVREGRERTLSVVMGQRPDDNVLSALYLLSGVGRKLLPAAVAQGRAEAAQALIASGSNVNARDDKGCTMLCLAVQEGHSDIVQVLIDAGADVNARNAKGCTTLCLAVQEGHSDIVQVLIDAGAEISLLEKKDGRKTIEAFRKLEALGTELPGEFQFFYGKALIRHSHVSNYEDLLKGQSLIKQFVINAGKDSEHYAAALRLLSVAGRRLLFAAVTKGQAKAVRALIAAGVAVNAKDDSGVTPLRKAIDEGHAEIAQALIDAGADVKGDYGSTLLLIAINKGHAEIALALIAAGAEVNAAINRIRHGNTYIFVDAGAEVNAKINGGRGETLLQRAIFNGHAEIALALIGAGADVNAKDCGGGTRLHHATKQGLGGVALALIAAGANVNAKDSHGRTPLHFASQGQNGRGLGGVVQALIAAGANVNAKDSHGKTPLHFAIGGISRTSRTCAKGEVIVQALIDAGANVNTKDRSGGLAGSRYDRRAGANVNTKDRSGRTPLAKASRCNGVVRILKAAGAK